MSLLTISSWNMRGWGSSEPFAHSLLDKVDVLCIQEHMLYPCEAYKVGKSHKDFSALMKCSNRLDDFNCGRYIDISGGVGIMYRSTLKVDPISFCSDRICGIRIRTDCDLLHVICVYLPQAVCSIASYKSELEALSKGVQECASAGGHIIVIGDVNAHVGREGGLGGWGKTSKNGNMLCRFATMCNLDIVDLKCNTVGPKYSYISVPGELHLTSITA